MSVSRIAALTVLVPAFFVAPERARATVDISGRWLLVFNSSDLRPQVANFVQAGTSLTVTLPTDTLTGTIDPMTGVFSVSDNRSCDPPASTGPTTLGGTEKGDGLRFSGSYSQSVGSTCNPVVSLVDGLWAPATSCPEYQVHDWVWRACDCLHATSNRVFRRCYRAGVRQLAAELDASDECIRELFLPKNVRSTCGRPHAVVCCTDKKVPFSRYYAYLCGVKSSAKNCVVRPTGRRACISPGQQECFDGVDAPSNCACLER